MTDWNDLTPDDVVTSDELDDIVPGTEELAEEVAEIIDVDPDVDVDTPDPNDMAEIADSRTIEFMEHIATEECESEKCERIRENLDIDVGGDSDSAESDTDESTSDDDYSHKTPFEVK